MTIALRWFAQADLKLVKYQGATVTLLLALANRKNAVLVADRRITADGTVVDDEHNKVCVLFCDDARLVVAFTGLATFAGFNAGEWIVNTLSAIGESRTDINGILEELKERAAFKFSELECLSPEITLMFCGFVYWSSVPEPRIYILSNARRYTGQQGVFQLHRCSTEIPMVNVAGMSVAFPGSVMTSLQYLLENQSLSPSDLVRFAVKHMRATAFSGRSGGLIGESFNAAVLSAAPNSVVTSTYHTTKKSRVAYGANVVIAGAMMATGIEISGPQYLAGPEIRKSDSCWCGSGNRFKHCHLKKEGAVLSSFRKPLPWVVNYSEEGSRPAGNLFVVSSAYA